jgi:hypothetical protein
LSQGKAALKLKIVVDEQLDVRNGRLCHVGQNLSQVTGTLPPYALLCVHHGHVALQTLSHLQHHARYLCAIRRFVTTLIHYVLYAHFSKMCSFTVSG